MRRLYQDEFSASIANSVLFAYPTPLPLSSHLHEKKHVTSIIPSFTHRNKGLTWRALPGHRMRKSYRMRHARLRDAPLTGQAFHPRSCAGLRRSALLLVSAQAHADHLRHARLLHRHAINHVGGLHHALGV